MGLGDYRVALDAKSHHDEVMRALSRPQEMDEKLLAAIMALDKAVRFRNSTADAAICELKTIRCILQRMEASSMDVLAELRKDRRDA